MPTRTANVTKEHNVAGSHDYGNSKDNHAPIGYNASSGWSYRDLMEFPADSSVLPDGARLIKATLRVKTTTSVHLGFVGTSPSIQIRRLGTSFAATGGSGETWQSGANPNKYGDYTTEGGVLSFNHGAAENDIHDFDITGIFEEFANPQAFRPNGAPCGGEPNHGIEIRAASTNNSDHTEYWSIRGSYPPRIVVEYSTEADPEPPTLISPAGTLTGQPTEFVFSVPAGDTATQYDINIGSALDLYDIWDTVNTNLPGGGSPYTIPYTGPVLTPGVTYYCRVRTLNSLGVASGWAAYSKSTITVTPAPTVSIVSPTAGGRAHVHNLGDKEFWEEAPATWAKPRATVLYTHPQGLASQAFEARINGGTAKSFSGTGFNVNSGSTVDLLLDDRVARNTDFLLEVRAQGSGNLWSPWVGVTARVNWGQGVYSFTSLAGANAFTARHSALAGGTATQVAYLYKRTSDANTAWQDSLVNVTPATSMDMLIRLSTSNAGENPALPYAQIEWSEQPAIFPDFWEATNGQILQDNTFRRFGVHSVRITPSAAGYLRNTRVVDVSGATKYTMSAYVHTRTSAGTIRPTPIALALLDGAGALLKLAEATSDGSTTGTAGKGDDDWQRLFYTFTTPPGETVAVKPAIWYGGVGQFWVDAFQFEEGEVATSWKPGTTGPALVVDVGGIAIDGKAGGIFRLRTSGGNIIEMRNDALYHDGVPLVPGGGGGGGGPTDATYLVATSHVALSAEIPVGATPGGELGGTWDNPTVDTTHSGSTHAAAQAAAEGTAAAALGSHGAAADPHTGYVLESAHGGSSPAGHHGQSHDHSAAGDGTFLKPSNLWIPGSSDVRWGGEGAGFWYDIADGTRRAFFGLDAGDDTVFRIYSPLAPASNKFSLDLDTGNLWIPGIADLTGGVITTIVRTNSGQNLTLRGWAGGVYLTAGAGVPEQTIVWDGAQFYRSGGGSTLGHPNHKWLQAWAQDVFVRSLNGDGGGFIRVTPAGLNSVLLTDGALYPEGAAVMELGLSGGMWRNLWLSNQMQAAFARIVNPTGGQVILQRLDTSIAQGDFLGVIDFDALDTGGVERIGARIAVLAAGPNGATFVPGALWFYTVDAAGAGGYRWEMNGQGHWAPIANNAYDIGGLTQGVRSVYATSLVAPTSPGYLWLESQGTGLVWNNGILYRYGSWGQLGTVSDRWTTSYMGMLDLLDQADPTAPAAGAHRVWAKSDGLYVKDSAGVVVGPIGAAGAGGSLTDHTHATSGSGVGGGGSALAPASVTTPAIASPSGSALALTAAPGQVISLASNSTMLTWDGYEFFRNGGGSLLGHSAHKWAEVWADSLRGVPTDHVALADPHPGYLTPAEGNAAYATAGHAHAPVAPDIQRFTSGSGNWTKPAGALYCHILVVGGGGASGSNPSTGAGLAACSGGGGGGGYAEATVPASALSGTVAYAVGAAGAKAAAGANNGGVGGNSSFGAYLTADGGGGGTAGAATSGSNSQAGGTGGAVGGTLTQRSVPGATGMFGEVAAGTRIYLGAGGGTPLGPPIPPSAGAGRDATGYGAGGGGCTASPSTSAYQGGNGAPGLVIVETHFQ